MKRKEKIELSRESRRNGIGWRKSLGNWPWRMKDRGERKGWVERWCGQHLSELGNEIQLSCEKIHACLGSHVILTGKAWALK